ncbi:rRNA primary transcript metabolism protein [Komagataella phaffii CBS 7435]|uniref:rRNA primary transcript metabolism protein n=1 Tax=Komagataella phaffii (strain ATCC 76273 / CBS 7435 / CECT 11047 / NRRL Y-11430 / Wegner 21-1) TaxID=981350 RepID=F2QM32_KOMPC|nr:GQ67_02405T0 [Komagataella phaffii]AOA66123.1 GQ68_02842T0 [Komagataella phaffii GS115]CAH2445866.1 rRNA primary transcript metabolism protein [Komagataella phaffii CBS 7435]CCA36320.1 rRNA primary transcript metabolism protein [Komagataella phaffii CBS 7435]
MNGKLTTSDAVTRYLRGRNTTVEEIIDVSTKLINNELPVYLPDKETFIFKLLCDRLNDPKNEKFHYNWRVWKLFHEIYYQLSDNKNLLRNLKASEVLSKVAEDIVEKTILDKELIDQVFDVFELLLNELFIGSRNAVKILKYFISLCLISMNEDHQYTVFRYYSSLRTKTEDKVAGEIFKSSFENLLRLYSISQGKMTKEMIEKYVLYAKKSHITAFVEQITTDNSDNRQTVNEGVIFFGSLLVDKLSKNTKDMQDLNELYSSMIRYYSTQEMRVQMLEELIKRNRTLEPYVLDMLVLDSIATKSFILIETICKLNPLVVMNRTADIFSCYRLNDNVSSLNKTLTLAFVNANELDRFIRIWSLQATSGVAEKSFLDSSLMQDIADNIHTLSFFQLNALIDHLLDAKRIVPLTVVAKGMCFIITNRLYDMTIVNQFISHANKLKPKFDVLFTAKWLTDPSIWELRYTLLCLYDADLKVDFKSLIHCKDRNEYYFYTCFKAIEIDPSIENPKIFSRYLKWLSKELKSKSAFNSSLVSFISFRWIKIIEICFSNSQIKKLLAILLKGNCFFEAHPFFFEQERILDIIFEYFCASSLENPEVFIEFFESAPIQVFSKQNRIDILKVLNDLCINGSDKLKILSINLAVKLLKYSIIESPFSDLSNLKVLFKKFAQFPAEALSLVSSLCSNQTSEFTESLSSFLLKQNLHDESLMFKVSHTVLINSKDSASQKLNAKFIEVARSDIVRYAKYLVDLPLPSNEFSKLKKLIIEGSKGVDPADPRLLDLLKLSIRINCFRPIHILALYLNVGTESFDLTEWVSSLDDEAFFYCFDLVIKSLGEKNDKYPLLINLLQTFIDNSNESPIVPTLLSRSLSSFISQYDPNEEESNLIFLNAIQKSLVGSNKVFTAYLIEQLLVLLNRVYSSLENGSSMVFVKASDIFSFILIYHRSKLYRRDHLLLTTVICQLKCLFKQTSQSSAVAFERVVTNLCQPPNKLSGTQSLVIHSDRVKEAIRPYLPVLVLNYVSLKIKDPMNFTTQERKQKLESAMFIVLQTLKEEELQVINSSLDESGRVIFKSLYDTFRKDHSFD